VLCCRSGVGRSSVYSLPSVTGCAFGMVLRGLVMSPRPPSREEVVVTSRMTTRVITREDNLQLERDRDLSTDLQNSNRVTCRRWGRGVRQFAEFVDDVRCAVSHRVRQTH